MIDGTRADLSEPGGPAGVPSAGRRALWGRSTRDCATCAWRLDRGKRRWASRGERPGDPRRARRSSRNAQVAAPEPVGFHLAVRAAGDRFVAVGLSVPTRGPGTHRLTP